MTKLIVALALATPFFVSVASAKSAKPEVFSNQPVWKCDGGEEASATHIDLWANEYNTMSGGIDRVEGNDVVSKPIEAKYGRFGTVVYVYTVDWIPRKKNPGELDRTIPKNTLLIKLAHEAKNVWTGTLVDTGVTMKCTDHTKDE